MVESLDVAGLSVLLVTDNLNVGGVQKVVVQIANLLHQRGVRVGIAADRGDLFESDLAGGIRRHFPPAGTGIRSRISYARWLRATIRAHDYSLVHAHQRGVALVANVVTLLTSVPVVEHVHNTFKRSASTVASFRSDELVACGPAIEQMLLKQFKRPAARVTLVANSVADAGYGADLTLPIARGASIKPRVVAVGRLSDQKDPLRFTDVIAELNASDGGEVFATWVGDGNLRSSVEQRITDLQLGEMDIAGETGDVRTRILSADLLLMTSRWEGLPLVILEAMALGRGIVASDAGGSADLVNDGVNGLIYPLDASASDIAADLRPHLGVNTLVRWGERSRALFLEQHSPELMIDALSRVYARAVLRQAS